MTERDEQRALDGRGGPMTKRKRQIHYAGPIRTSRMRVLPGWAACCSGDRAERIRAEGAHSYVIGEVTCRACLRTMARDPQLARLPVRCPSMFRGVQCAHGNGHSGPHEYVEAF